MVPVRNFEAVSEKFKSYSQYLKVNRTISQQQQQQPITYSKL